MLDPRANNLRRRIAAVAQSRGLIAALVTACVWLALPPLPAPRTYLVFDRDATINLATAQVPIEIDSFYFFVLDSQTSVGQDSAELARTLQRAALDHEYLGIVGPDPERNRQTLLGALEAAQGNSLAGVVVIYVGPVEQADELMTRMRASGAQMRFVALPEPQGQPI